MSQAYFDEIKFPKKPKYRFYKFKNDKKLFFGLFEEDDFRRKKQACVANQNAKTLM